MKLLPSALLVFGLLFGVWKLWDYWDRVQQQRENQQRTVERAQVDPRQLPGLPKQLEQSLEQASLGSARNLRAWLDQYKQIGRIQDPRLAWVELDYVVKVSQDDPMEAKKVFADVKARTPQDSPVYSRIKQLEKTYE